MFHNVYNISTSLLFAAIHYGATIRVMVHTEEHQYENDKEMVPCWIVMTLGKGFCLSDGRYMMSGFAVSWVSSGLKYMQSVRNQVEVLRQIMYTF